MNAVRESVSQV